jgi:hypothetical protein
MALQLQRQPLFRQVVLHNASSLHLLLSSSINRIGR